MAFAAAMPGGLAGGTRPKRAEERNRGERSMIIRNAPGCSRFFCRARDAFFAFPAAAAPGPSPGSCRPPRSGGARRARRTASRPGLGHGARSCPPCCSNGIHLRKRVHSLRKAHRSAGRPAAMLPAAPPCLICGSGCGSGRRGASTLSDATVRAASCRCKRRCPRSYSRPLRRPAAHARARPPRAAGRRSPAHF